MALLVYFRKVNETEREVEYRFGETEDQLDRHVVISKADQTVTSEGNQTDPVLAKVVGRILSRRREAQKWVGAGAIQA